MESSAGDVNQKVVADALAGRVRYDDLPEREQAAVRQAWEVATADAIRGLDYRPGLTSEGESWAEADGQGRLVLRPAVEVDGAGGAPSA